MPLNRIYTNSIYDANITGAKVATNAIRGNNIVAGQITGNLLAANSVTSNTLNSNLSISITRVSETINVSSDGPGGNVNIDVLNSTVHFFATSNSTANLTFNLRGNNTTTFDSAVSTGQSVSLAILVKHGTARHSANLYIDGGLIPNTSAPVLLTSALTANSLIYAGNSRPGYASIATANSELNLFSYTVFKLASNTYTVLAGNTLFGLG